MKENSSINESFFTSSEISEFRKHGFWIDDPLYRVIDRHAERNPGGLCVSDGQSSLTYQQFVAKSSQLARALLDLGLSPGDAIVLQTGNDIAIPLVHFAANRAGLLFSVISDTWREKEMIHLLRLARARVAILPPPSESFDYVEFISNNRGDLPDLQHVICLDSRVDVKDTLTLSELLEGVSEDVFGERSDPDLPLYAMVSSGTTELPKISLWTDNNLWHFLNSYGRATEMTHNDRAVGIAPANTGATGYVFPVLAPLLFGASSRLLKKWDPVLALDALVAEKATMACAIPTQVIKMMQESDASERAYKLRFFTNAGAPLPKDQAMLLESTFRCRVHICYGASDGGVAVIMGITDPVEQRVGSVGRVIGGSDVQIIGDSGARVPIGQTGEIVWRSPTKSYGYLNDTQRTQDMFDSRGTYRSGDLGYFDDSGYLHIVGRSKDLIIRGGQNISPVEIEGYVLGHPSVSDAAAVGVPDKIYGERVVICISIRAGQTLNLEDLNKFLLAKGIAKFKLPERLLVITQLPKNAGGKVDKENLRKLVAATEF